jgi:hypothetical protein
MGFPSQVGELMLSWEPRTTHPQPFKAPTAWPRLKITFFVAADSVVEAVVDAVAVFVVAVADAVAVFAAPVVEAVAVFVELAVDAVAVFVARVADAVAVFVAPVADAVAVFVGAVAVAPLPEAVVVAVDAGAEPVDKVDSVPLRAPWVLVALAEARSVRLSDADVVVVPVLVVPAASVAGEPSPPEHAARISSPALRLAKANLCPSLILTPRWMVGDLTAKSVTRAGYHSRPRGIVAESPPSRQLDWLPLAPDPGSYSDDQTGSALLGIGVSVRLNHFGRHVLRVAQRGFAAFPAVRASSAALGTIAGGVVRAWAIGRATAATRHNSAIPPFAVTIATRTISARAPPGLAWD